VQPLIGRFVASMVARQARPLGGMEAVSGADEGAGGAFADVVEFFSCA
jgi:hypothetical protein